MLRKMRSFTLHVIAMLSHMPLIVLTCFEMDMCHVIYHAMLYHVIYYAFYHIKLDILEIFYDGILSCLLYLAPYILLCCLIDHLALLRALSWTCHACYVVLCHFFNCSMSFFQLSNIITV